MAVTITRDDIGTNKGLRVVRTWKRWDSEALAEVTEEETIVIHQSDVAARREELARQQAQLDAEEARIDALEAKLTQLWQAAA